MSRELYDVPIDMIDIHTLLKFVILTFLWKVCHCHATAKDEGYNGLDPWIMSNEFRMLVNCNQSP